MTSTNSDALSEWRSSDDEHLRALGLLSIRSSKLEEDLRDTFVSLVGSKYAAVVAAGQAASWLIDQCQALVKAHLEISDDHKTAMKSSLDECKKALEQRNILVHGLKFGMGPGGQIVTMRSRRGSFEPNMQAWPNETIKAAAVKLSQARAALHDAINDAVSYEMRGLQYALANETSRLRNAPADDTTE